MFRRVIKAIGLILLAAGLIWTIGVAGADVSAPILPIIGKAVIGLAAAVSGALLLIKGGQNEVYR